MKTFHEFEAEGAFKNNFPYPSKSDFTRYNIYGGGKVLGVNKTILESNEIRLGSLVSTIIEATTDEAAYKEALHNYRREQSRIEELFQDCLYEEFGVVDNPKKDKCMSLAWSMGHSSGYNEVWNYFSELVELIK